MYHHMKKNDILESLMIIQDFSKNFPMMKLQEINFHELAKFYNRNPKDLISMICFLDCMNVINQNANKKNKIIIDLNNVSKIKIKKNNSKWVFFVYKNANSFLELSHTFKI